MNLKIRVQRARFLILHPQRWPFAVSESMLCVEDPAAFQAGERRADPGFMAKPLNPDLAQGARVSTSN
jgi:hypothetical protein